MRKSVLREYLSRLEHSTDKERELATIIKEQTPFWLRVVDICLMTALLVAVLFAQVHGYYTRTIIQVEQQEVELLLTENGTWNLPTNITPQMRGNLTLGFNDSKLVG